MKVKGVRVINSTRVALWRWRRQNSAGQCWFLAPLHPNLSSNLSELPALPQKYSTPVGIISPKFPLVPERVVVSLVLRATDPSIHVNLDHDARFREMFNLPLLPESFHCLERAAAQNRHPRVRQRVRGRPEL